MLNRCTAAWENWQVRDDVTCVTWECVTIRTVVRYPACDLTIRTPVASGWWRCVVLQAVFGQ